MVDMQGPGGAGEVATWLSRDQPGARKQRHNVTVRPRRELHDHNAELARANNDLRTILDSIPEGVLAIDAEQQILFANQNVYRLFQLSPRRKKAQKLWELIRHPGLQEAVAATFASREPYSTEFELLRPPRVLSYHGRSLSMGSGRAIILVLHDLT